MKLYREIIVENMRLTLEIMTASNDAHSVLSEDALLRKKVEEVLTNTASILYGVFTQRAIEVARFKEDQ